MSSGVRCAPRSCTRAAAYESSVSAAVRERDRDAPAGRRVGLGRRAGRSSRRAVWSCRRDLVRGGVVCRRRARCRDRADDPVPVVVVDRTSGRRDRRCGGLRRGRGRHAGRGGHRRLVGVGTDEGVWLSTFTCDGRVVLHTHCAGDTTTSAPSAAARHREPAARPGPAQRGPHRSRASASASSSNSDGASATADPSRDVRRRAGRREVVVHGCASSVPRSVWRAAWRWYFTAPSESCIASRDLEHVEILDVEERGRDPLLGRELREERGGVGGRRAVRARS